MPHSESASQKLLTLTMPESHVGVVALIGGLMAEHSVELIARRHTPPVGLGHASSPAPQLKGAYDGGGGEGVGGGTVNDASMAMTW